MKSKKGDIVQPESHCYEAVLADVVRLIEVGRSAAARSVNAVMTATYWSIGRRIVEEEQRGAARAGYGEQIVVNLSSDLQARFGRGFGRANLYQMKSFFLAYRDTIQTGSGISRGDVRGTIVQTASGQSPAADWLTTIAARFKLPWSHYVRLLSLRNLEARRFYEQEALRGGWTIKQLDRQRTLSGENPPVGLILCAQKDSAVAKYALEGLPNKVLAAEYRTALPEERVLVQEIERTRRTLKVRIGLSRRQGRK